MTYEELHKRFLGHSAAWFEVDEIYEAYILNQANGWGMPKEWLIDVKCGEQLKNDPGMYGLRLNERGQTSVAGIPATVGEFNFRIAVIAGGPYQCRVGDFVETSSLPWKPSDDRDFVYVHSRPTPRFIPAGELLPEVTMQVMAYRRQKFGDSTRRRAWFLWRRES